jgi:hypothetical protein
MTAGARQRNATSSGYTETLWPPELHHEKLEDEGKLVVDEKGVTTMSTTAASDEGVTVNEKPLHRCFHGNVKYI